MRGNVDSPSGQIGQVYVGGVAGLGEVRSVVDDGTPGESAADRVRIRAKNGIRLIVADRIYANIEANYGATLGDPGHAILKLRTTGASTAPDKGVFVGSLVTDRLVGGASSGEANGIAIATDCLASITIAGENQNAPISIGGDAGPIFVASAQASPITVGGDLESLDATYVGSLFNVAGELGDVFIDGDLDNSSLYPNGELRAASLPAGKTVRIEKSLLGKITLGSPGHPGLHGQVIVNAGNTTGVWTGLVRVEGPTGPVIPPNYTQTAAELGGGAIGVARFALHPEDCVPVGNSYNPGLPMTGFMLAESDPSARRVRLRHYGPVQWSGAPYAITFKRYGTQLFEPFGGEQTGRYTPSGESPRSRDRACLGARIGARPDLGHGHVPPCAHGARVRKRQRHAAERRALCLRVHARLWPRRATEPGGHHGGGRNARSALEPRRATDG